jgi:hypothetical protein
VADAAVDVGHLEGDVDDPVAVAAVVVDDRACRVDPALQHEPDRAGAQHVGVVVAVAGLRARVRHQLHAERELVERGRLGGVADGPHDGVPAGDRERVAVRVVLDEPDELAQLVEVELGQAFLTGEGLLDGHAGRTAHPRSAAQLSVSQLAVLNGLCLDPRNQLYSPPTWSWTRWTSI